MDQFRATYYKRTKRSCCTRRVLDFRLLQLPQHLPYVKRWHDRYSDKGLTIVGVHSPEFDEERNTDNVRKQVASLGIRFPVVTDNDYQTWRAYKVEAWPTIFLLDKAGQVRWTHVGEGAYDEAEQTIQKLLAEKVKAENVVMTDKVEKTDVEWRKELTPRAVSCVARSRNGEGIHGCLLGQP